MPDHNEKLIEEAASPDWLGPEAPSPTNDERAVRNLVRRAVGGVLFNVSNFPDRAQSKLWGANMGPLNEKITDAVLDALGQAHAPTDDELAKQITALHWGVIRDDALSGDIADAGRASAALLRRSVVPEPSAVLAERERAALHAQEGYRLGENCDDIAKRIRSGEPAAISARPEPQGEPSEAQVHAGWVAINGAITQAQMLTALRAAGGVR